MDEIGYYEDRADGLRSVVASGLENGIAVVRAHHPALAAASEAEIRAIGRADARLVLAREHGFASWAQFRRHVEGLAESGEPFRRAFKAIEARNRAALGALLDRYPGLVAARGTNGNDLLGLAAGGGRRSHDLVRELLARGADPSSANDRGWTPLHQAGYGNDVELARLLLEAGARTDVYGHGEGGTPLAAALFWGNTEVAELLAEREIAPRNLRIAAGLGRLDLIRELVRDDGSLSEAAGARARLLPAAHGLPDLAAVRTIRRRSSTRRSCGPPRATAWTCSARSSSSAPTSNGDPYRGTPLIWAAACGHVAAIRRLVELGAEPSRQATFGGGEHGQGVTALHIAAQSGKRGAVEALLAGRRGSDDPGRPLRRPARGLGRARRAPWDRRLPARPRRLSARPARRARSRRSGYDGRPMRVLRAS